MTKDQKIHKRLLRGENWILKNGTQLEKRRIMVKNESKKLVMKQMDFVDVVQKGILQDAYYEALYPRMFKTLIPIAMINKVRNDLKKQTILEQVQKTR